MGEMTSGEVVTHPLRFDGPDWAGAVIISDNADGTIAVYTVTTSPGLTRTVGARLSARPGRRVRVADPPTRPGSADRPGTTRFAR